jgi:hypothetical protein
MKSRSIPLPPCTYAQPACAWHAACSFMHVHGAAAPRVDTHTAVQIQLCCTPSSWRRREALLFSWACPSQLVNVLELISKGAESPPLQLEFATSTGPLGPDPPKLQIGECANRFAKPDLLQTDPVVEGANKPRGRPLLDTPYDRSGQCSTQQLRGAPWQAHTILGLHTNPPYKRNTALSELARAMHDGKSIHEIHVKFRNSENTCKFKNLKSCLKISYNDENPYQQLHA